MYGNAGFSLAQTVAIEKIVLEILHKNSVQQGKVNGADLGKTVLKDQVLTEPSKLGHNDEPDQKEIDETAWTMIADTMSAFRNS